ncbi:MAG: hypothetical protein ACI305_08735 [Lepagella sp.]
MTEPGGGDLLMEGGGCVVAGSEQQTIEHVLVANRGEWREHPLLGGEVMKMKHGIAGRMWAARAREMCREAGVAVRRVAVGDNGKITVE